MYPSLRDTEIVNRDLIVATADTAQLELVGLTLQFNLVHLK